MAGKRRKSLASHYLKAEEVLSNVDLLTEILLRLPAVSVIRFKCVAKLWRSIISDPKFANDHTSLNAKPTVSGLYVSSNSLQPRVKDLTPVSFGSHRRLPALSFLDHWSCCFHIKYEDSSNGLFLCSYSENISGQIRGYFVCNPTTGSYKLLPQPPAFNDSAHIAYFPSKAVYKVVSVDALPSDGCINFQIFSSDTASWKQVKATCREPCFAHFTPSPCRTRIVSWDGGFHWMDGYSMTIHFRFDAHEEKMETKVVPRQPKILGCHKIWYFGACGGRLFLIQTRASTAQGFRVLEMGKGCSGWIVKFRFNLRTAFPMERQRKVYDYSVLRIVVGDKENDTEIVLAGRDNVVSYNLKRRTLRMLSSITSSEPDMPCSIYGFEFQGSLASP